MPTSIAKAIDNWKAAHPHDVIEETDVVKLYCQIPPIDKLDSTILSLSNVKHLSLSTNAISNIIPLTGFKNLEILSLGRNNIKKIAGLDDLGGTLRELWISYNSISSLDGLANLSKLTTLFITNNKIANLDELKKLNSNSSLTHLSLVGNPIYDGQTKASMKPIVKGLIPHLKNLDGELIPEDDE